MEVRNAKLLVNRRKTGSGGTTFRATLPTSWIREMGLGEETRMLELEFNGKEIIIKNNKEENNMLKLKEMIGKKMTLKEMDNEVLDIIGGGESIFEYGEEWWGEYESGKYAFSYQDKYNIYFDMVEKNKDKTESIITVIDIDLI